MTQQLQPTTQSRRASDDVEEKVQLDDKEPQSDQDLEQQSPHDAVVTTPRIFSRKYFFGRVKADHGDVPLLACCFVTGMVDAASFRNWGMFIGMQTGNTVILGVSSASLPENPYAWLTTLVSLLTFLLGAFVTFRTSFHLTPSGPSSNRSWVSALFALQGLILLVSAALASVPELIPQLRGGMVPSHEASAAVIRNIRIVSLIPPLAFQGGMQIATSRLLGFNELPVNVLTSTYADIMGDVKLWATHNVKRNRRVLAVVLLLLGAIVSGWLMRSEGGLMSVLWVAGVIKVLTGAGVFVLSPAVSDEESKS